MRYLFLTALLLSWASAHGAPESVKVSDFGYDPEDSTEFIRKALASGAKKVTLDRQAGPWYTLPLKMPSDIEFVLEPGVELVAKRGEFKGRRDYLMELSSVSNVTLRGGAGSAFRMWKCDYQKPPYEHSEWRYALRIVRSSNVLVEGLKFLQSGGDGIGVSGDNITIRRCVCDGNHRQGMSVFSVRNLLVEDTVFSNTKGTPPQAGVDIEPDVSRENLKNVVFRNCESFGNAGNGFEMYLVQLNRKSGPIDITYENCRSWGNGRNDTTLSCNNRKGQPSVTGVVRYVNCAFGPSRLGCVSLSSVSADSVDVQFVDTVLTNTSESAAVRISVPAPHRGRPDGVDFGKLTVFGDGDWFRCSRHGSGPVNNFHGKVTVISSNGIRRTEIIDGKWIERNLPVFDGGRPVPGIAQLPSPESVVVADLKPGEMVETEPFTVLDKTPLVFFADKPGECRFEMRQVNAVSGRKLGTAPLLVVPVGGGRKVRLRAPGDKPEEVVFKAKKRGFYRILPPKWGTRLRIDRTSVPLAVDATQGMCTVAPLKRKPFSLSYATRGGASVFLAYGSDFYRFGVSVSDANGKPCESSPLVDGMFISRGGEDDAEGYRKVMFNRAVKPNFDHIKLRLYGGGGMFFLAPEKRWR